MPVADFEFGGQRYAVPGGAMDATLDVSHTTTGYSLRMRFGAVLEGPCMRCLEEAGHRVDVDGREVDQPGGGEELTSPYLEEGHLDVGGWARDALVAGAAHADRVPRGLPGPVRRLRREPQRGGPRSRARAGARPRWAALRELKIE